MAHYAKAQKNVNRKFDGSAVMVQGDNDIRKSGIEKITQWAVMVTL